MPSAWPTRILEAMREPIFVGVQECFVTASVGIAIFPRDGATSPTCCATPTSRCTRSSRPGRNSVVAVPARAWPAQGREKLELESALHKAIERDELVLHYQPKIDVRGARMVGAEALMRWQPPAACWCRRATSSRWPRKPA